MSPVARASPNPASRLEQRDTRTRSALADFWGRGVRELLRAARGSDGLDDGLDHARRPVHRRARTRAYARLPVSSRAIRCLWRGTAGALAHGSNGATLAGKERVAGA